MSATSGTSSATSGTLGNAPPVSFPGIASGIDYNSIIEKYTADTLQQEQPTQTQINNLNKQNTAILKITNLIGAVQDSLTALSDPTTFRVQGDGRKHRERHGRIDGDADLGADADCRKLHHQRPNGRHGDEHPQQSVGQRRDLANPAAR
jgi:hypothetical protein